ncbi:MAG: M14 family zinc carboxypeptidase [Patescibacteria group bacterium]|jgi:glutamine cyclotransferase
MKIIPYLICGFLLMTSVCAGETVTVDTQAEFEQAIISTGLDTTTTSGSLQLSSLTPTANPELDVRNVAFLCQDKTGISTDFDYILNAYFDTVDYYNFSEITDISNLAGYDIVITYASTFGYADNVPQDIVEQFASSGGTVIQHMVDYQHARQEDYYGASENIDRTIDEGNNRDLVDMTWDGTYFWAVEYLADTATDMIHKINKDTGAIISSCDSPANEPRGIEYTGGFLYVLTNTGDMVYKLDPDDCSTVGSPTEMPVGFDFPTGLAYDGSYFWVSESTDDQIMRFQLNPGGITATFDQYQAPYDPDDATTNRLPRGLGFDGTNIWVADNGVELAFQIDITDGSVESYIDTLPYDPDDELLVPEPYGVDFIDGNMWILENGATEDHIYNNDSYYLIKDVYEYSARGNESIDAPGGDVEDIAYDGTYVWTIDQIYNRIYKLNKDTGATVSYLNTPCVNPRGLDYYGGSLWLACSGGEAKANQNQIMELSPTTGAIIDQCTGPGSIPEGLAHDGTNIWLSDTGTDTIYALDPSLDPDTCTVNDSFAIPGSTTMPRGLAYYSGTGTLWLADEGTDTYYELSTADGSTISTRDAVELSGIGLTFVDGELWSSDHDLDRIYDIESGTLCRNKFDSPGNEPRGLAYDGTNIWHVDATSDLLYKLNAATGAVVSSYASLDSEPKDLAWDGTNLWMVGDTNDRIYKINPADGTEVTHYDSPSSEPSGIAWDGSTIWTSDNNEDEFYKHNITTLAVEETYNTPSDGTRALAFDGTDLWVSDFNERAYFRITLTVDEEGEIAETVEALSSSEQGMEFIGGDIYTVNNSTDRFYDEDSALPLPEFIISEDDNQYTAPWKAGDELYMAFKIADNDDSYIHRRLLNVPAADNREILATSNRGGDTYIHETVGSGNLFAIDLSFIGKNYETVRTTFPGNSFILDAMGININDMGVHDNERLTYADLTTILDDLVAANPAVITKEVEGQTSDGDDMISINFGTEGKPMIIYTSGLHGNEEHAYIAEVHYIEKLVELYNAGDEVATNLFRNYRVKFIPLVNTYGIKNLVRHNANHVDINRNFDYYWAPDALGLYGTEAFSEIEARILRDIITNTDNNVIFVNDAHAAKNISPGFTWGRAITDEPQSMNDAYDIFTAETPYRWFEERAGVGRWLTYDRYERHIYDEPYFANWITSTGVVAATNEVMGKKDTTTNRYVHTSSWYLTHFHAVAKSFSYKAGEAVYRIDTGHDTSSFSAFTYDETKPTDSDITYTFSSNSIETEPATWYATYSEVPTNRYLFVKIDEERTQYDGETPKVNSLSISYWYPDHDAPTISSSPSADDVYYSKQAITLTATDDRDTTPIIYYTKDGTTPTTASTLYTAPFNIKKSKTIKAIAVDNVGNTSSVYEFTYTLRNVHKIPLIIVAKRTDTGIIKVYDKELLNLIVRIRAFPVHGVQAKIFKYKGKKYLAAINYSSGRYLRVYKLPSGHRLYSYNLKDQKKRKLATGNLFGKKNKQEVLTSQIKNDHVLLQAFSLNKKKTKLIKKADYLTEESWGNIKHGNYSILINKTKKIIMKIDSVIKLILNAKQLLL